MGLQGCEMCKLCIILLLWLPTKRGCTRAHSINKALYVSAMQDAVVEVLLKYWWTPKYMVSFIVNFIILPPSTSSSSLAWDSLKSRFEVCKYQQAPACCLVPYLGFGFYIFGSRCNIYFRPYLPWRLNGLGLLFEIGCGRIMKINASFD